MNRTCYGGWLVLGFFFAPLLNLGCRSQSTTASEASPALDDLLTRINERLQLMKSVARVKFQKGLPAADAEREEEMLRKIQSQTAGMELSATQVRWFFASQIEAAKLVQEHFLQKWKSRPEADLPDSPDLASLRERIDQINLELLSALVEYRKSRVSRTRIAERAALIVTGEGIDDTVRRMAIRPLLEND